MPADGSARVPRARESAPESIRALATVTLDAAALDALGPETVERLADLVAAKLAERKAADAAPLLTTTEAAEAVGVNVETLRRAIRRGALPVAGYVGKRPRLRRESVDAWVAGGCWSGVGVRPTVPAPIAGPRPGARAGRRVLGDALRTVARERSGG